MKSDIVRGYTNIPLSSNLDVWKFDKKRNMIIGHGLTVQIGTVPLKLGARDYGMSSSGEP